MAVMWVGTIDLTNQNIVIDSYDSNDPNKSTNGLYDPAKQQQNGDIATDGQLIEAGNAHIYGDVATNAGTVTGVANNGHAANRFLSGTDSVGAPSWSVVNPTVTNVTNTTTITADSTSGSTASRYQLSSISLNSKQVLTIAGNPDGSPSYVEIYVTGDISVSGTAQIVLGAGVKAKIYFAGNVDVSGNGILNTNSEPSDLQMYGIAPTDGSDKHVSLGGNGEIMAAVYAPNHDVTVNGGGTNGHVFGSVIGKTVTMTGVTNLHYDEALNGTGLINNYRIVSWFEDNR